MLTTAPELLLGIEQVLDRLRSIEAALQILVREKTVKEWYSTAEVAKLLGKAEYTVQEWCRQGRVRASKKPYARGAHPEWLIGHDELRRLRNRGLRSSAHLGGIVPLTANPSDCNGSNHLSLLPIPVNSEDGK